MAFGSTYSLSRMEFFEVYTGLEIALLTIANDFVATWQHETLEECAHAKLSVVQQIRLNA
jgi:hypothetical protein